MNTYNRNGNRWTVNELLSLQREYELLEWTVGQISEKHQRSVEAILFRLESEGFINSWNDARGFNNQQYQNSCLSDANNNEEISLVLDEAEDEAEDEESVDEDCAGEDSEYFDDGSDEEDDDMSIDDVQSEVDNLNERVFNLETSVKDISSMVRQMFDNMVSEKKQIHDIYNNYNKRTSLRKD